MLTIQNIVLMVTKPHAVKWLSVLEDGLCLRYLWMIRTLAVVMTCMRSIERVS